MIEATAFGSRIILENFENYDIRVDRVIACGGIAMKNDFLMQVYADATGRKIEVVDSPQAPALGSAILGAVAAGKKAGGYDTIQDAAAHMAKSCAKLFAPDPENVRIYNALYHEYVVLHDYFGRGMNTVLKTLKKQII